jgi:energy-coupling factor transporter ATP-binding protein EcfA2
VVIPLNEYVDEKRISEEHATRLREAVENRENILIAGGTGSGKTTFANALLDVLNDLNPEDRLVVLEDTLELQYNLDNVYSLRTDAKSETTMQSLVKISLRLRPDRIIVGEVRGGEALDLLKSWNTGHPGGISTLHANSAESALIRLEQLVSEVSVSPMKEWLKVLRKNNCAVILATQSLNDIVNSPIMDAVLDSCETRILLPNPNALSESMKDLYMKHLALSEHQVSLIAHSEKKKEYYYACETTHCHRLFSLMLGPVALAFTGASGKEDLAEVRRLVAAHGKRWPEKWLEQRKLRDWSETWKKLHTEN